MNIPFLNHSGQARKAFTIAFLALTSIITTSYADRIDLNNGTYIEGTILSESAQSVEISYNVTPTIKDNKTIPRSEIKSILKEGPDEIAYKVLFKLFPLPDLLKVDDYSKLLETKLNPFIAKFPTSKRKADVERLIGTVEAERSKIAEGYLKVDGKWISPQEYSKDKYNYDGMIQLHKIHRENINGNYLEAMRNFDAMSEDYGASAHYPAAVKEAQTVLKSFQANINQLVKEAPIFIAQRNQGLTAITDPSEKRKVTEAMAKEATELADKRAKEKAAGYFWYSYDKYDLPSIQEVSSQIDLTIKELASFDPNTFPAYSALVRDGMKALKEKKVEEVPVILAKALAAGAPKELITKLEKSFAGIKEEAQKAQQAAQELAAKNASNNPSTPTTPGTAPAPMLDEVDNIDNVAMTPLQKAMAKQEKEAEAARQAALNKAPEKPKPSLLDQAKALGEKAVSATNDLIKDKTTNPPQNDPKAAPSTPEGTPPASPTNPTATPNTTPSATPAPPAAAFVSASEGGFGTTHIIGAGAGILLIVTLLTLQKKQKAKKAAASE